MCILVKIEDKTVPLSYLEGHETYVLKIKLDVH
jgi:hypothetical protein